jgi:peptidoglycan/xylan/chitin deacetylase (PgdA/CDA1 family)
MALVPILLYHSISGDPLPLISDFAIDERRFGEHLDRIAGLGLESLTVTGFLDAVERGDDELLRRCVVITFDDGFADFATAALPAMTERGLTATLYVTTGLLRGGAAPPVDAAIASRMLDWSQLADLHAAGVELGAHSHTHPHMDTVGAARAHEEIARSKSLLESAAGAPVETFAYPHGYSSPRVRRLVRGARFRGACGVKNALSSAADDRFSLARLMVDADTSAADVERWLRREGAPPHPARESARTRAWRAYRRTRALVRRRPGSDPGWPSVRDLP